MTEAALYAACHAAHAAYLAEPTAARGDAWLAAFEEFAAVYIEDPVAAFEETEELRRKLQAARPRAERLVPRWP
jgi:HAMP domain-containing protein